MLRQGWPHKMRCTANSEPGRTPSAKALPIPINFRPLGLKSPRLAIPTALFNTSSWFASKKRKGCSLREFPILFRISSFSYLLKSLSNRKWMISYLQHALRSQAHLRLILILWRPKLRKTWPQIWRSPHLKTLSENQSLLARITNRKFITWRGRESRKRKSICYNIWASWARWTMCWTLW